MFKVGQRCVCVDVSGNPGCGPWMDGSEVVENRVYTVRSTGITTKNDAGVRLQEVTLNARHMFGLREDLFYRASRFRPIVSTSKKSERNKIISKLLTDGLNQEVGA